MTGWRMLMAGMLLSLCSGGVRLAQAADPEPPADRAVVQTKSGLHFRVPADWPIEERNGVTAPVPIEEYVTKKFAALEARIRTLEQQLSGSDLRLRVLEEGQRTGAAGATPRLRSGEGNPQ